MSSGAQIKRKKLSRSGKLLRFDEKVTFKVYAMFSTVLFLVLSINLWEFSHLTVSHKRLLKIGFISALNLTE